MTSNFGPWTTAIHDHAKAQLAAFWKRRFDSLPAVSGPRSTSRVSSVGLFAVALLGVCLPTFLAAPAQAEKEPAPATGKADADQQDAPREDIVARRAERLKQLEKNADPQLPQARRPDVERKLSIEFVEQPARGAFEYLGDAYHVQIMLARGDFQDRKVNLKIDHKPLRDSLNTVCARLDFDWDSDGYVVYAGPEAAVKKFRRLVATRDERRRKYPAALARRIQERAQAIFVEQELGAGVRMLSAATEVPMRVADAKLAAEPISFATENGSLPLDVLLDLISIDYDLNWEIDNAGTVLIKRADPGQPAAAQPRESEESLQRRSRLNLQKIGRAMHLYHDRDRQFPAAASIPPGGSHLVSWRVLLLPYLGEEKLYGTYRIDEPWDSEHNRKLIEQIPSVYVTPTSKRLRKGYTSYVVPVGAVTLFPAGGSRGVRDCRDGVANTLLVVEADAMHSVPWTRPEDLEFDDDAPYKGLIGHRSGVFVTLFADGSTGLIPELLQTDSGVALGVQQSKEVVRRLFNLDDGLPTGNLAIDQRRLR